MADNSKKFMSRHEVAAYTPYSKKSLDDLAAKGEGPPFWIPAGSRTGGKAIYIRELVDRWIQGDPDLPKGRQTTPIPADKRHQSSGEPRKWRFYKYQPDKLSRWIEDRTRRHGPTQSFGDDDL